MHNLQGPLKLRELGESRASVSPWSKSINRAGFTYFLSARLFTDNENSSFFGYFHRFL